jgi:hypothetical protein
MKKLLLPLLLFAAIALLGHSQSLQLSNIHGVIPANSIMVQEGSPDSSELITYMNVKNVGTKTVNIFCKKSQLSMLDSTELTMCWAGNCYPANVNVSPYSQPITAGQTITEFVGHYTQIAFQHFKKGESVVRWVFFDRDNANDSMSVTIKYTSYPLGIAETTEHQSVLSNAYPNPAGVSTSLSYSIPSGSDGAIIIRNLLGATMQSEQLRSTSGKIILNTTNLSDGIYFYSLLVNGKISQTKKLIVKH